MKIYLVDDHGILLQGIKGILENEDDIQIAGSAKDAETALREIPHLKPDILITDYNLPGNSGLDLIKKIKPACAQLKIIVLSMHDEPHLVRSILKENVDGYLLKNDSHNELLSAIDAVQKNETYLSKAINKIMIEALRYPDEHRLITDREKEIVELIAKEYNNKQIAETLFISERTVETHRKNIFRKTKTGSVVGLLKFAYANGILREELK